MAADSQGPSSADAASSDPMAALRMPRRAVPESPNPFSLSFGSTAAPNAASPDSTAHDLLHLRSAAALPRPANHITDHTKPINMAMHQISVPLNIAAVAGAASSKGVRDAELPSERSPRVAAAIPHTSNPLTQDTPAATDVQHAGLQPAIHQMQGLQAAEASPAADPRNVKPTSSSTAGSTSGRTTSDFNFKRAPRKAVKPPADIVGTSPTASSDTPAKSRQGQDHDQVHASPADSTNGNAEPANGISHEAPASSFPVRQAVPLSAHSVMPIAPGSPVTNGIQGDVDGSPHEDKVPYVEQPSSTPTASATQAAVPSPQFSQASMAAPTSTQSLQVPKDMRSTSESVSKMQKPISNQQPQQVPSPRTSQQQMNGVASHQFPNSQLPGDKQAMHYTEGSSQQGDEKATPTRSRFDDTKSTDGTATPSTPQNSSQKSSFRWHVNTPTTQPSGPRASGEVVEESCQPRDKLKGFWEEQSPGPKKAATYNFTRGPSAAGNEGKRWSVKLNQPLANGKLSDLSYFKGKRESTPPPPPPPASFDISIGDVFFTLKELQGMTGSNGIDPSRKELYLSDDAFQEAFGFDKASFGSKPKWRQVLIKKKVNLF